MVHKDYIIIGSGIIGLSLAKTIKEKEPNVSIVLIDKEAEEAFHASSRNSGVLHAGFYYSANSLKAKFTVLGNRTIKEYCEEKNIPVNNCGKLVIAQNEEETEILKELETRGRINGSNIKIIDESQAKEYEPNVVTYKKALYSPDTATINPKVVCRAIKEDLEKIGVEFLFSTKYLKRKGKVIETTKGAFEAKKIINCAGLYADKIAQDFGFGHKYTLIPFKGLYLMYTIDREAVKMHLYPVPNLRNPFLGVHFTKTVEGDITIGPTAIPALWRENYERFANFNINEFIEIFLTESKMFFLNASHFRDLAFDEIRKYNREYFIREATKMVQHIEINGFTDYTPPGIRAQLIEKKHCKLINDFVVEGDKHSAHVLNAVSPAFTCSFPFTHFVYNRYIKGTK